MALSDGQKYSIFVDVAYAFLENLCNLNPTSCNSYDDLKYNSEKNRFLQKTNNK